MLRFLPWMLEAENLSFSAQFLTCKDFVIAYDHLSWQHREIISRRSESNTQRQANQAETKMNKSKNHPENNVESLDLAMLKLVYPWIFQLSMPKSLRLR